MRAAARSALLLLLAGLCGPALAGTPVQRLLCTRLSGARIHDLTLVIDDKEKSLDVEPEGYLSPLLEPQTYALTFKRDRIEWSYMRGTAVLDRKTGRVDWDDTGEYEYLEEIGQPDARGEDNYRGKMQCKVVEKAG